MKKTLFALALVAGALTTTPQLASAAPAKARHAHVSRVAKAKLLRIPGFSSSSFECQSDGTLLSGITVFGIFINTSGDGVPNSNLCK